MSAVGIATQQVIAESSSLGIDTKTALSFYVLDSEAFTMSFQILAIFAVVIGFLLLTGGAALRAIGAGAILTGLVLLVTGLVGTISILSDIGQVGLLLFELWVVVASVYFLIRPLRITRAATA